MMVIINNNSKCGLTCDFHIAAANTNYSVGIEKNRTWLCSGQWKWPRIVI